MAIIVILDSDILVVVFIILSIAIQGSTSCPQPCLTQAFAMLSSTSDVLPTTVAFLGVDTLIFLRTCSQVLRSCIQSLAATTPSLAFLMANDLRRRGAILCPPLCKDWSLQNPRCSSPCCRALTGIWAFSGSKPVEHFLDENVDYTSVACSTACLRIINQILALRRDTDRALLGQLAEPAAKKPKVHASTIGHEHHMKMLTEHISTIVALVNVDTLVALQTSTKGLFRCIQSLPATTPSLAFLLASDLRSRCASLCPPVFKLNLL